MRLGLVLGRGRGLGLRIGLLRAGGRLRRERSPHQARAMRACGGGHGRAAVVHGGVRRECCAAARANMRGLGAGAGPPAAPELQQCGDRASMRWHGAIGGRGARGGVGDGCRGGRASSPELVEVRAPRSLTGLRRALPAPQMVAVRVLGARGRPRRAQRSVRHTSPLSQPSFKASRGRQ